jgi:ATP-binding cassette subfamily F protein uup
LLGFDGSVLLVTHDRYFLDKVATAILAFEGEGRATRYPGNYEMYRTLKEQSAREAEQGQRKLAPGAQREPARDPSVPSGALRAGADAPQRPRKLSFNEQRELEGIEATILAAEEQKAALEAKLSDPATYATDGASVPRLRAELEAASAEVERLYARWQELEALKPR